MSLALCTTAQHCSAVLLAAAWLCGASMLDIKLDFHVSMYQLEVERAPQPMAPSLGWECHVSSPLESTTA
jgi:hypothetical protein